MREIVGTAAGVPYVALPPMHGMVSAPAIVAWHFHDPPRSETAMAAAVPLRDVAAWRIYFGLPYCGRRLPKGGLDEFNALGYRDAVMNLFEPTCRQALAEFAPAFDALRTELPLDDGPIGLLGGSVGAFVALSVLTEIDIPVAAVGLVSPALQLAAVVEGNERRFGVTYSWANESRAVAERLDFLARADQIIDSDAAVLFVVGASDDGPSITVPAERLWKRVAASAPDRTALISIPGMGHALAEEPGLEAAPQNHHASRVDTAVSGWFQQHLPNLQPSGTAPAQSGHSAPSLLNYLV